MNNFLKIRKLVRFFVSLLFYVNLFLIAAFLFTKWFDLFNNSNSFLVKLISSILLIAAYFILLSLIISIYSVMSDKKLINKRHHYRKHIIISILGSLVVIAQLLNASTYRIAEILFTDQLFPDLSVVLFYQSILWLNITYLMVSKTIMLVPNYRILNLQLVKVAVLIGILMFIIINPILIKIFNNSIQILISLSNIILMNLVLIYDFRLTVWFKDRLKTDFYHADSLKPDLIFKFFLNLFFIEDHFSKFAISDYKPLMGDCSLLLSNSELFSIDSFDKILFSDDKFYNITDKYDNEIYFFEKYY